MFNAYMIVRSMTEIWISFCYMIASFVTYTLREMVVPLEAVQGVAHQFKD